MRRRKTLLLLAPWLLAAILGACNRQHDPDDFSPTAPGVSDALVLSTTRSSITADESSTTEIVATLNPDAVAGRRTVEFTTSTGSFVGAPTDTPKVIEVEAVLGVARVTLKSSMTVETALIQASVKEGAATLAAARLEVQFVAPGLQVIQLTADRTSIPADGFSRTELVAAISPDSPSDRRTVVFTATSGTLVNGTGTPSTVEVVAGRDHQARAELISSQNLESSIVTASLKDVPGAVDRLTIRFDPPNPTELIRLSTSRREVPADGATVIQVTAEIAPGIPAADRTVTFTTTAGTFVGSATVRADASNRATVDLKADTHVQTAVIRATVSVATAETTISFVPALPDSIIVNLGNTTSIHSDGTETVAVTAELFRHVGTVTDGTVVEFSAVNPTTGATVPLLFRNVVPSVDGKATALLIAPADTPAGTVAIRARVRRPDGTFVSGQENISVID